MFRTLRHSLLIGSLILAVGFHWPVLQGAAWVGMFVNRVRTQTVTEALHSTFNGRNPCRFCRLVAENQSPADAAAIDLKQLEGSRWQPSEVVLTPPVLVPLIRTTSRSPGSRPLAPPVPPPRLLPV